MYPDSIQKLIERFSKFPTVGPRTAARFISYLMGLPKEKMDDLVKSLRNLKEQIKFCSFCFNYLEGEDVLCPICKNQSRDKSLLCVVEKEIDLEAIEKTKKYSGFYFILGGTISSFKKTSVEKLRIEELEQRIRNPQKFGIPTDKFSEVIIAVNPTPEGDATLIYIQKILKSICEKQGLKISRLGRGLPIGGELEYADEETLKNALEGRK